MLLVRANLQTSSFHQGSTQDAKFQPYVSVGTGLQYNVPLPLIIRQNGSPDIKLTARYDTKPFAEVPYYDIKLGMARRSWAFELELVHHKLYLVNLPPEVDTFEITHGYNPLLLNCVRDWAGFELRGGAGVVITHPQTTVRGLRFPETGGVLGWFVSGPALQVSFGREFGFGPRFFAGLEGKAVGAWARVPIVDGSADVPNVSLHALVSAGWRF